MTRRNLKDYTQMQIKKSVLRKLEKIKIHPQQSYCEVIEGLLKSADKDTNSEPEEEKK